MKRPIKLLFFILFLLITLRAAAQTDEKSQIHGYLSQGFLYSDHNNYLADTMKGTFQFNELGINFNTQVIERLRIGIQFAALDLGDVGNDKLYFDWAYADYRFCNWFGIRLGKVKIPMGFYNKTRDIDMLRTFVLLPQSIYSETFRDTLVAMKGMGAYGEISLHALGDISYEILGGTMNIDKEGSTTKGIEDQRLFFVDRYNVKKALCGQISWETPLKGLRLGFSRINIDLKLYGTLAKDYPPVPTGTMPPLAAKGTPIISDTPDLNKSIYSLEFTWNDLILAVEYSRQNQTNIVSIAGLEDVPIKKINKQQGFYASATYQFQDWFEAGVYYSEFYKNRDDRKGILATPFFSAYQKDVCLSLRFNPNDYWTFKLEGHLMNGTSLCWGSDNSDDKGNPNFVRKWYLLAAKMTFSF